MAIPKDDMDTNQGSVLTRLWRRFGSQILLAAIILFVVAVMTCLMLFPRSQG